MDIPVEGGEIEFHSNYRLLEFGKKTLASPMAALGFPAFSAAQDVTTMDAHLKKLESLNAQMRVFMAQESTNGDNFLQPLGKCKAVLERIIAVNKSRGTGSVRPGFDLSTVGKGYVNSTYSLITERLLFNHSHLRQSRKEVALLLLDILCLIVTVHSDTCSFFPQTFSSCLLYFRPSPEWRTADVDVMNRLCYYVLQKCLAFESSSSVSMSATLMMVLEGCAAPKDHLFIVNTLMQLKKNVCSDILSAIAYGTATIRQKSLNLLLHYWPIPIPEFSQRSNSIYGEWTTPMCENSNCRHKTSVANMICLDPLCVPQYKMLKNGETTLYMLLCPECDSIIHGSPPSRDHARLRVPRPLHVVKPNCEFQKICSGKEKQVNRAEVTCYDSHCTSIQDGQPIRMCRDCHNKQHKDISWDSRHIYQVPPPNPWAQEDPTLCNVMLEAVSILLETTPRKNDTPSRSGVGTTARVGAPHNVNVTPQIEVGSSREGIWMLSHYATPTTVVRDKDQFAWLVHLVALTLNWLQEYHSILHSVAVTTEDHTFPSSAGDLTEVRAPNYYRLFSNFADVASLVNSYTVPWFRNVCESNIDCVCEALKPERMSCAQVGRLWNELHDPIERHKHTLSIMQMICLMFQDGKLPENTFLVIFKTVMPIWLDYLVKLRVEPGKMDVLQEQIVMIFSHEKHADGLKTFAFIWDKFRTHDPEGMQKALFWLQDLTRLKTPIAYLKHMFEDALKEKKRESYPRTRFIGSIDSSFDQESEKEDFISRVKHKESTGSMSGYESESALLSEPSMDLGDTQVLFSLNSSLTRFIIMLDIWLSQLRQHQVSTLDVSSFYSMLVKMYRCNWGSNHTNHHQGSSGLCLLCHGMELWFGLATKLVEEYAKKEREESTIDDGGDDISPQSGTPSATSVRLGKVVAVATSNSYKRKKFFSSGESPDIQHLRPRMKKMSENSIDMMELTPLTTDGEDISQRLLDLQKLQLPPSPANPRQYRQRKQLPHQSPHSEAEVRSTSVSGAGPGGAGSSPGRAEPGQAGSSAQEESLSVNIYTVFNLTIERLTSKLDQSTKFKIIECLATLMKSGRVLQRDCDVNQVQTDLEKLFNSLWLCLETDRSDFARSCVGLLLGAVNYLASLPSQESAKERRRMSEDFVRSKLNKREKDSEREGESEGGDGLLWKALKTGLTAGSWTLRFKTIEKLTFILQFMLSCDHVGLEHQSFHDTIKETLAHGFCLLTQLLLDKNSSVCSRARYCITSIKESSLEATRHFLTSFFQRGPPHHRTLILHSLSTLDSSLPEMHFLHLSLLNKLMNIVSSSTSTSTHHHHHHHPSGLQGLTESIPIATKKVSEVSLASGSGGGGAGLARGKLSTTSSVSLFAGMMEEDGENEIMQQILTLLLRHIGNPRANVADSMQQAYQQQQQQPTSRRNATIKKASTPSSSEEMFVNFLQRDIFNNLTYLPYEYRNSPIFEIFLINIFPVLDNNIQFGLTKGLLSFILRLLCYSASPNIEDFLRLEQEERQQGSGTGPAYSLGDLPAHLQAQWLRVYFVILYKYIHNYSDSDVLSNPIYYRTRWCLFISLNSLESRPHECPLPDNKTSKKAPLQRQGTIESFGSEGIPPSPLDISVVITEELGSSLGGGGGGGGGGGREVSFLTPVPEDFEGSLENDNQSGAAANVKGGGRGRGGGAKSSTPTSRDPSTDKTPPSTPLTLRSPDKATTLPPGRCVMCGRPTNEFSEEVVALCAVVVGTYCNRLPHGVPRYLVSRIIPAVSKVVTPGSYSWQKFNHTNNPLPGSASAVGQRILASILAQFAERRLFLYLFGYNYGDVMESVFMGIASSLSDLEGEVPADQMGGAGGDKDGDMELFQSSPIKYFLEDSISSLQFNQEISKYSLINMAAYLKAIDDLHSQAPPISPPILLTRDFMLWDLFLKRLKSHEVIRDKKAINSLLQILIQLFQYTIDSQLSQYSLANYRANAVQSVIQSLASIVETILHSVSFPLGGMVMLAGLWYRIFQQHSHRESEKLVKVFIHELRKALKAKNMSDALAKPENFLCLIQVLLLEEDGYLGYVDGLTEMKHFAPELKQEFETHCLTVIQSSPWDFSDALSFLSNSSLCWPHDMVPQLKLSLAQLIALRVQHGRPPVEKLRKMMVTGENRITVSSNSKTSLAFNNQWSCSLDSLHLLSWLLLGAMTHNAIHSVASEMKTMTSSGGQCLLLQTLSTKMDEVVKKAVSLTRNVLQRVAIESEPRLDYLQITFLFGAILTVYIEMYVAEGSTSLILEYWEKVAGCLSHQLSRRVATSLPHQLSSTKLFCNEVIHSLNEQVVARVREIDLGCYTLLLPVWQEIAEKSSLSHKIVLGSSSIRQSSYKPMDVWFDEVVEELYFIEVES